MKEIPDMLYLKIAGYVFQLSFQKTATFSLKDDLKRNIIKYYGKFLLIQYNKPVDFYIEIVQAAEFMVTKQKSSFLIQLYEKNKENKITTYYQVGPVYFLFIIKKILIQLLGETGFIVHASSSFINGKANIFLGLPEAGKSTIVRLLSKKYSILSDEHAIIKIEENQTNFYQTPFFEDNVTLRKAKEGYPLGKIFFLRKASFFKITKIKNKNMIFRLLMKQIWIDQENHNQQVRVAFNFVSRFTEFYLLYFAKDSNKLIKLMEKNS